MDEKRFEQFLREAIEEYLEEQDWFDWRNPPKTVSFEEAGVLTRNRGLVLQMPDGSEFQIQIVCSGHPRPTDDDRTTPSR